MTAKYVTSNGIEVVVNREDYAGKFTYEMYVYVPGIPITEFIKESSEDSFKRYKRSRGHKIEWIVTDKPEKLYSSYVKIADTINGLFDDGYVANFSINTAEFVNENSVIEVSLKSIMECFAYQHYIYHVVNAFFKRALFTYKVNKRMQNIQDTLVRNCVPA